MRSATPFLYSLAIMALAALPLTTPVAAQVLHDGLLHHALGSATLQYRCGPREYGAGPRYFQESG